MAALGEQLDHPRNEVASIQVQTHDGMQKRVAHVDQHSVGDIFAGPLLSKLLLQY
jgi:hypothetical protein